MLIQEIGELAKQTGTKHRTTPFPASWVPSSEADTVRDPNDRKELDLYPFRRLLGVLYPLGVPLAHRHVATILDLLWLEND